MTRPYKYKIEYTVNKGESTEFKTDREVFDIREANEIVKQLKRTPNISDIHRRSISKEQALKEFEAEGTKSMERLP